MVFLFGGVLGVLFEGCLCFRLLVDFIVARFCCSGVMLCWRSSFAWVLVVAWGWVAVVFLGLLDVVVVWELRGLCWVLLGGCLVCCVLGGGFRGLCVLLCVLDCLSCCSRCFVCWGFDFLVGRFLGVCGAVFRCLF